ncbi:glycosyltransferase [Aquiflexum sp. LQ15W]|uniref:glycosyltransferase family 2 protein n=1 Tax=Cognataquiflexum nitidum TaxID=2922272 RepID=UPI001F1372ED|nr:glycosyltransferase family 2 protein [Cognataquiflexum nitidum]MCH6201348.1 glycosyltransferase [Cognataquiflexum nitidum]
MNKIRPKISIITPSFNQGQYIEQTILSIIDQDYDNIELIVIDGGSTDETVSIIKKYEDRIAYWVSEPDRGQAHAINKGLAVATGMIFNWINSDDYLEPGALKEIAAAFSKDPSKKIMCGYTHCFYNQTRATSHTYRMGFKQTVAATILNVEMNQPGSFYGMDVIRSLGGVNESLRYVFDGELWFRFLSKYSLQAVGYTDALLAHFRLHETSKSVGEGFFEFYKEFLSIHLFLAKQLQLMPAIIGYLENDQYIERYVPGYWDYTFLEKEALENIFAEKYKFLLYKDRYYEVARKGLRYYRMQAQQEQRLEHLKLGAKLLLPDPLIEWIRKINKGKQHG